VANETLAHLKVGQFPKDADWSLTDGRSVRFAYALNDGGKADYALFDRQGRVLAVLKTKSASVNPGAGETREVRCANA
jgi:type I restriction enzyme R subunit